MALKKHENVCFGKKNSDSASDVEISIAVHRWKEKRFRYDVIGNGSYLFNVMCSKLFAKLFFFFKVKLNQKNQNVITSASPHEKAGNFLFKMIYNMWQSIITRTVRNFF